MEMVKRGGDLGGRGGGRRQGEEEDGVSGACAEKEEESGLGDSHGGEAAAERDDSGCCCCCCCCCCCFFCCSSRKVRSFPTKLSLPLRSLLPLPAAVAEKTESLPPLKAAPRRWSLLLLARCGMLLFQPTWGGPSSGRAANCSAAEMRGQLCCFCDPTSPGWIFRMRPVTSW